MGKNRAHALGPGLIVVDDRGWRQPGLSAPLNPYLRRHEKDQ
jgi:hypothetical protein